MTQGTRDGTDAATASKILRGLRERVERLERRNESAEEVVHLLRSYSDAALIEDAVTVEITEATDVGFGRTPFGTNFGDPDEGVEAIPVTTVREFQNTTTIGYHRYLANCTLSETIPGDREFPPRPTHLAVGTGSGPFSWQNTELSNEIARVQLADAGLVDDNRTAVLRAILTEGMFVGDEITELGIVSDVDDRLFNLIELDPPLVMTEEIEVTVEARLTPTDESAL